MSMNRHKNKNRKQNRKNNKAYRNRNDLRKKTETVSLLDLMAETDEDGQVDAAEADTADLPPITAADGEATADLEPTDTVETAPSPPLPLAADELTPPQERPLFHDQGATEVQPRVAFPGSETPVSEAPTQPLTRPSPDTPAEPTPDDDEPTIVRPPLPTHPPLRERPRPEQLPTTLRPRPQQPARRPQPARPKVIPQTAPAIHPRPQTRRSRGWRSCLTRILVAILLLGIAGLAFTVIGAALGYMAIANDLPESSLLLERASSFETARIYDRDGNLLYSLINPEAGDRTRVSLDEISPHLINATIATEDSRFYQNPGFDPSASPAPSSKRPANEN